MKKDFFTCGIDEAGRGPVVGPLVISSVCIKALDIPKLIKIGVRDSKSLSSSKREAIYDKVLDITDSRYIIISPSQIDKWVLEKEGLNALEAFTISKLLTPIMERVNKIFIDAPSTPTSFNTYLKSFGVSSEKVVAEPKADLRRPVVGAASIVAKVIRDREIDKISQELGFSIGSGYPSSPTTLQKLPTILEKRPGYVRKSWKTLKRLGLG